MERILRGDLRFSCTGFTYLRIASRLYASAPSETSAHTGRRTSLRGLFCVLAMGLPNKIVYAIRAASARCQPHSLPRERQPPRDILPSLKGGTSQATHGITSPTLALEGTVRARSRIT